MKKYRFAIAVIGELEAPDEQHARFQAMMGVALTGRLLVVQPDVAIQVAEALPVARSVPRDGGGVEH